MLRHRQAIDVYLLALTVRRGGRLVTFDRRIDPPAVPGALPRTLHVPAWEQREPEPLC